MGFGILGMTRSSHARIANCYRRLAMGNLGLISGLTPQLEKEELP
jgi:hypothetical protein